MMHSLSLTLQRHTQRHPSLAGCCKSGAAVQVGGGSANMDCPLLVALQREGERELAGWRRTRKDRRRLSRNSPAPWEPFALPFRAESFFPAPDLPPAARPNTC